MAAQRMMNDESPEGSPGSGNGAATPSEALIAGRKLRYDGLAAPKAVFDFYGTAMPRPYVRRPGTADEKRSYGVLDAVLAWAADAPFSLGGLNDKRTRFVGVLSRRARKPLAVPRAKSALALYASANGLSPADARAAFEALTEDEREDYEEQSAKSRAATKAARAAWKKAHPNRNAEVDRIAKRKRNGKGGVPPPPPPPPPLPMDDESDEEHDDALADLSEDDADYIPKRAAKKPRMSKPAKAAAKSAAAAAALQTPRRSSRRLSQPASEAPTPSAYKEARFNAFAFSPGISQQTSA